MKKIKLFFYRWGMRYNFEAAVTKYEQNKNNPIIKNHIEACHIYSAKILKILPNDKDANEKYSWSMQVLSK